MSQPSPHKRARRAARERKAARRAAERARRQEAASGASSGRSAPLEAGSEPWLGSAPACDCGYCCEAEAEAEAPGAFGRVSPVELVSILAEVQDYGREACLAAALGAAGLSAAELEGKAGVAAGAPSTERAARALRQALYGPAEVSEPCDPARALSELAPWIEARRRQKGDHDRLYQAARAFSHALGCALAQDAAHAAQEAAEAVRAALRAQQDCSEGVAEARVRVAMAWALREAYRVLCGGFGLCEGLGLCEGSGLCPACLAG